MIEVELGRPVQWINPKTGGWESGRIIGSKGLVRTGRRIAIVDSGLEPPVVLVAGTFGGIFAISNNELRDMPMRSEWERVPTAPPKDGSI